MEATLHLTTPAATGMFRIIGGAVLMGAPVMDSIRPNGRFRRMLAGMLAAEQARRLFLMMSFRVFVGDSGNGHPPVFVLAGFISTVERWEKFEIDWQEKLDSSPKITYFKMKEAKAMEEEFLGFGEEQRDAKLHSLMSVITEHAMAGLYAKADFADWQDVMSRRISKDPNTPYVLLAYDRRLYTWVSNYHIYGWTVGLSGVSLQNVAFAPSST